MLNFNKKIKKWLKSKKHLKTGLLLLFIVGISILTFSGLVENPFADSLNSFQRPSYIPKEYLSIDNNTTSN